MSNQSELDLSITQQNAELLNSLFRKSERILVKKLSNNDRDWARYKNKHQAGVYIPQIYRDSDFFPPLVAMNRVDPDADEIREVFFTTIWPQTSVDELERESRLVHYTSKGQETHMTRLPKSVFAELMPASYLVIGRMSFNGKTVYKCLTIDSDSDEITLLHDLFDIGADFLIAEFDPADLKRNEYEQVLEFAEQVVAAWLRGELDKFALNNAAMPGTADLALLARQEFLKKYELDNIDPFELSCPGDVLREISRSIEWDMFREFQRKERSVELVRIVLGDVPCSLNEKDVIRSLINKLPIIDALMLSASQQRKSRAGYSYEHHIEAMLTDGNIPFEKQVIIEAKKRPDFVLPSRKFIDSGKAESKSGLILSAKTTLRERWKQVEREKGNRNLYLTTVDENIASNAIEDMGSIGVFLVVPESLMRSKDTEYDGHENVLSFREFCDRVIKRGMEVWV